MNLMRLQFKRQKFQQDASDAVCNIFQGQPYSSINYILDTGKNIVLHDTAWANAKIELDDETILARVQKIQRENQITVSEKLEGKYNFTIEMETGVGKTYTYIKTMFELYKKYGWSKYIIVVPSIAIREGVYKTLQITQEHFAQEYGKKIRFFIYDSKNIDKIVNFALDTNINVMIINAQAFNARGKDARRIYRVPERYSLSPIEMIAETNPILIIDEPQSVEGKKTKEGLKEFNPLFTLRYSATHKKDSIYNMVYRLDAVEAYNKKLVKKIKVKGITQEGINATEGYVFVENINLSKKEPTATIQFDVKGSNGIRKLTRQVSRGFNLYDNSGELDEYQDRYIVNEINGKDFYVEFLNGKRVYINQVSGEVNEEQIRRIQIRETILSHLEKEQELFNKGIKVLSLFFIDEVEHYKKYDEQGQVENGIFAQMFEEEYEDIINHLQLKFNNDEYRKYLESISTQKTHAGYFSIDKKGRLQNSKVKSKKENISDDVDAYDLIMKDKERLLSFAEPVRFVFSHSALREGWDNPNVFQICTLKQANSEIRKRQEVGRGLRLCVNQKGERMDEAVLGKDVQEVNELTIVASESYENFAKALQNELAEVLENRPRKVSKELFIDKLLKDEQGNKVIIDEDIADSIYYDLVKNSYIDKQGNLTNKYYEDKKNNEVKFSPEMEEHTPAILDILGSIYDKNSIPIENASLKNIEAKVLEDKLNMPEFKELWQKINQQTAYHVEFDSNVLIKNAIDNLNRKLDVVKISFKVEKGKLNHIKSKEELMAGKSFEKETRIDNYDNQYITMNNNSLKYDLIGRLVEETGLTRKDIVAILTGIEKNIFNQFKNNPEDFIIKAGKLINEVKATTIIGHIEYDTIEKIYDVDIFSDRTLKGDLNENAIKTKKHLYDHLIYDSKIERDFAKELDVSEDVAVYVKLPNKFVINTPVGNYNPDWAIAFYEGSIKHIYFVAETKGSTSTLELRTIEKTKIDCATKHFAKISNNEVVYDVVDSYKTLLSKLNR